MYYEEAKRISIDHMHNPQPGDFWHEMLVPMLIVLEVLPDNSVIVATEVVDDGDGGRTFDLEKAQLLTSDEFIDNICYKGRPGNPIGLVSTNERYQIFVKHWHNEGIRDRVYQRLLTRPKACMKGPLYIEELNEWMQGKTIEYASMTKDAKRLRLLASINQTFHVTHGSDTLYKGTNHVKAIETFNQTYRG